MIYLRVLFFGFFSILFIYHIFVYLGRKTDFLNLIFSFYCLAIVNTLIAGFLYIKFKDNILFYFYIIASQHILQGLLILIVFFLLNLKRTKLINFVLFYYILITIYLFILFIIGYILNNKFITSFYYPSTFINFIIFIFILIKEYILKKKYKEKTATIVAIGLSTLILFLTIYCIFMTLKIMLPFYIAYSIFLINALFFDFALTDSFNKEHKDLIELKESLEQKVLERTKQLEEAHKQKANIFINIAHETKTPLTLISNYLDKYIKKYNRSDELAIIKNNLDKLKKDMINYLDIQKLERGQIFYNHNQIINLSNILNEKIKLFTEIAWKNRIKIISNNIDNNIAVKIDPYAIDRIINNLIDNAIKYNKKNGFIEISLIDENDKVILIVKDTGIGISKEQQENIFNPYYQISHEKRNIQGIGMGLNIVKKIIKEVNGKIDIKSKINDGTVFKIIFKKYKTKKNEIISSNIKLSKPFDSIPKNKLKDEKYDNNKKNIFIVEDNIEMLCYLQNNFYDEHNVFTAINGTAAIKKINEIPKPNIIISDIMMDKMNGYEFYDELIKNENYNDIPFIFLTAFTSNNEKIKGLQKGAVDYIYKPFIIEELENKVNSLLKIQEYQKRNNLKIINNHMIKVLYEDINNEEKNINIDRICTNYNITDKEENIIKLLLEGLIYKDICLKLNISYNVIKKRIQNIYKKLEVSNRIELINKFN